MDSMMIKPDPDTTTAPPTGTTSDTSSASPTSSTKPKKTPKSNSGTESSSPSTTSSPSPKKRKISAKPDDAPNDAWSPDKRLRLFEAYQRRAAIKWEEVAEDMGQGYTGKQCREQWQRATGKKIRRALEEA